MPSSRSTNKPEAHRAWTTEEIAVIEEARAKLKRKNRNYAILAIVGFAITIGTLALGAGTVVIAYGPMIAGAAYVWQTSKHLRQLDTLQPGTPLNAKTLGVRTSADPPKPSQKRGAIVVGVMIGLVVLGIAVMWIVYG